VNPSAVLRCAALAILAGEVRAHTLREPWNARRIGGPQR
jgi:hypothetical protein